jgi:hypothetical protein
MASADDQGRAAAAREIKKALQGRPTQRINVGLAKRAQRQRIEYIKKPNYSDTIRRLANQITAGMEKCGLKPPPLLKAMAGGRYNGVGDCSVFRKIHARGVEVMTPDGEWLRKLSVPPQSSNGRNDATVADDGATLGTQRQSVPAVQPSRLAPPHSASISPRNALPTDDEDPTIAALKSIYKAGPKRGP